MTAPSPNTNIMSQDEVNGNGNDGDIRLGSNGDDDEVLIDPSLLAMLSKEERQEALAAAAAARRAEIRAEERALARAMDQRKQEREDLRQRQAKSMMAWKDKVVGTVDELQKNGSVKTANYNRGKRPAADDDEISTEVASAQGNAQGGNIIASSLQFVSKKQRQAVAQTNSDNISESKPSSQKDADDINRRPVKHHKSLLPKEQPVATGLPKATHLTEAEMMEIKRTYLGHDAATSLLSNPEEEIRKQLEQKSKKRAAKKITFKFEWDAAEDTSTNIDPLYDETLKKTAGARASGGRGGGRFHRDMALIGDRVDASRGNNQGVAGLLRRGRNVVTAVDSVTSKPIDQMTPRDWRIFRENYDIRVRGGKAPPPLRSFAESPVGIAPIHPLILDAIANTLRYTEPSPIQRQAIPIGLQRRDLIGIAETGSGKTAAFGIPLCHYILTLPCDALQSVADNGPLALVMAPTRELALQIDVEISKLLSKQTEVKTLAVVGGQSIQNQAYRLRQGAHIVVGTPGRINDCVEMTYLVLNQCAYIVLDEADRMIDLGFAPQIEQILDSMGGSLKSDDETLAYQQEQDDLDMLGKGVPRHRLTAMFSATMPSEVERIAKRYLRHPAMVSIGDQDSVKNKRIVQRVMYLSSPAQKEKALRDILTRSHYDDKIIVFVNEKKHAEGVSRIVERSGKRSVVLHGGKTQDQREENLAAFRRGGIVMVATDVAGRGLDIPDVSHVINYDLPSRSIDSYSHRIGRTGRAGKEGLATSFLTDADEGIMAPLKHYLESTNSHVPEKLARHPAAVNGVMGGNLTV